MLNDRILVQIGTYNANLQGHDGLPQNLVDWLAPSMQVSSFLAKTPTAPDIVAVGFQELLPLQLGFAGLSQAVMHSRDELIRSQLQAHAPNKEAYTLVSKIVDVGMALLVYARDDTVARHITDVQRQWTGCGPGWMGNKGAVGIRFRVKGMNGDSGPGQVYTFVNAHLTAHQENLDKRIADYRHIVRTLLFPDPHDDGRLVNIYETTHLFFFGDLNFRLDTPAFINRVELEAHIRSEEGREELKQYDQLTQAKEEGRSLIGLREGEWWRFQCTYKYEHGTVDKYHPKRRPAWTDRILYATISDSPSLSESSITPLVYTAIPSYTTSDHKPVMAILQLPSSSETTDSLPLYVSLLPQYQSQLLHYQPDEWWQYKRYTGKAVGWVIGWTWTIFWFVGAGNAIAGVVSSLLAVWGIRWWNRPEF